MSWSAFWALPSGRAVMALAAPKSAEEIQGLELDWLRSDADGHVALFSTAGAGFAPAEFLRDTDAHDEAIDAVLTDDLLKEVR